MKITKVHLPGEKFASLLLPLLEEKRDVEITVAGNSMYPLWKHGRDSVVLAGCDRYALKKGDVPLYRRPSGQLVLHRIVRVNELTYEMCGDAQTRIEYDLPKENVIAVVKSFTRKGKQYRCDHLAYRAYAGLWPRLRPLRSFANTSCRLLRGLVR